MPMMHSIFVMSHDASQRLSSLGHPELPSIGLITSMRPDVIVHQPTPLKPGEVTLHDLPAACDSQRLAKLLKQEIEKGAQVTQKELDTVPQEDRKKKLEVLLETEKGRAIWEQPGRQAAMNRDNPRQLQTTVYMALTDFPTWVTGIGYYP